MEPYAANYGGHQFGHWAGQLGDSRAITLGEVMIALMAGLNQLERVKIIKRTSDGHKTKKAAGGYAGGRPGYGQKKHWVMDANTGKVVEKSSAQIPRSKR